MHRRVLILIVGVCVLLTEPYRAAGREPEPPRPAEWTVDDVILSEEAGSFRISPDCKWVVWVKKVHDRDKNQQVGNLFLSSLTEVKEVPLTRASDSCTDPKWAPDGRHIAFLTSRAPPRAKDAAADDETATQLWLMNPFGGEPWPITSRTRGVASFAWAGPDRIVFAAKNEPPEDKEDGPKDTTIVAEDERDHPPVRLYRLNTSTKEVEPLTENNDRITTLALAPDGRWAVTIHERSQRYEFDNKVPPVTFLNDLKTGERKQIFAERSFHLDKVQWALDSKGFYVSNDFTTDPLYLQATVSELYYYDLAAGSSTKVGLDWERGLSSQYEDEDEPAFLPTPDGFLALLANGTRNRLARYTRQGDAWRRAQLTGADDEQVFGLSVGSDGRALVYAVSSASRPTQWYRARLNGDRMETPVALTRLNGHLRGKTMARTQLVRWKGARDDEVEGLLYYPHGYEPGKKYPLVVLIHGGPAAADFDAWGDGWSHPHNLLCQRGAFVLRPNYHGSTNYGLAWAESIRGRYYELEIPDIEKGVDALIARGLVDPDRLGVMGHSNGAILAAALTVESTRYKAASVMAGTVEQTSDWAASKYGASFDHYYLGTSPFADPSLYVRKSPFYRLDRVRTATLVSIGMEDKIVGPQQAWLHYRALQQSGKAPVRLLLFPGEGHELEQLTHQRRKVKEELAWFDRYLFSNRPGRAQKQLE